MKKSTSFVFDRYHNLFLRMLTRTRKWMQQSSESSSSDLEQSSITKTADTMSYPWPSKDMATLLLWVKHIICVWRVLPKMGLSSAWCAHISFDVTSCHPHWTANLYTTACVFSWRYIYFYIAMQDLYEARGPSVHVQWDGSAQWATFLHPSGEYGWEVVPPPTLSRSSGVHYQGSWWGIYYIKCAHCYSSTKH